MSTLKFPITPGIYVTRGGSIALVSDDYLAVEGCLTGSVGILSVTWDPMTGEQFPVGKLEPRDTGVDIIAKFSGRVWVKTFQPQFRHAIQAGTKLSTIRSKPNRLRDIPKAGDLLDAREWSGRPYGSPQVKLGLYRITRVRLIRVWSDRIYFLTNEGQLDSELYSTIGLNEFAKKDGFKHWDDLILWFKEHHNLPLEAVLIEWALIH